MLCEACQKTEEKFQKMSLSYRQRYTFFFFFAVSCDKSTGERSYPQLPASA